MRLFKTSFLLIGLTRAAFPLSEPSRPVVSVAGAVPLQRPSPVPSACRTRASSSPYLSKIGANTSQSSARAAVALLPQPLNSPYRQERAIL